MAIEWEDTLDFDGVNARVHAAIPRAIAAGLEVVRAVTTPKVPLLTAHLAGSGEVTVTGMQGTIRYPGPYARYQEFGVYYRHGRVGAPLTHTHGQSFYLTTGLIEATPRALEAVASIIRSVM